MGAIMSLSISPMSPVLQFMALSTVSFVLVVLVPFTKVEESFSIQAIHDFIYLTKPNFRHNITTSLQKWDHEDFPGVVARSFIGPFVIGILSKPFSWFFIEEDDKFYVQIIARFMLSVVVVFGFSSFGRAIEDKYGPTTRRALSVLTLTQFHFLFYSSRCLPNTFALAVTLYAVGKWIQCRFAHFIAAVAFTVIVLRAETVILYGWIILYEIFITRRLRILYLFKIGIPAGLFFLSLTVAFDSFMWNRLSWPEGEGLWFNIYLNKSNEWGTQPFLWYFYSALPRALLLTITFIPFCCKDLLKSVAVISFLFVTTYSFLPHKELRFVIYAIPMFNACAANTIAVVIEKFEENVKKKNESYLMQLFWNYWYPDLKSIENGNASAKDMNKYDAIPSNTKHLRRRGRHNCEDQLDEQYEKITAAQLQNSFEKNSTPTGWLTSIAFVLMAIHVWCNVAATVFMSLAAWHNYPGGEAVSWINHHITTHDNYHDKSDISVYVCNLAAQTGFTRFLQLDGVYYDKSERLNDDHFLTFPITYLVLEKNDVQTIQSKCTGSGLDVNCELGRHLRNCRILKSVNGFNGLDFSLSKQVVIKTTPMLWIFRCQK